MTSRPITDYTDAELLSESSRVRKLLRDAAYTDKERYGFLEKRLAEIDREQRERNKERSVLG